MIDTTYQRGKIIVEEMKKFYSQLILFTGLFIFIIIRNIFLNGSLSSSPINDQTINFIQNPLFIISYVGAIFTITLLYKYLKLFFLKRNFKNSSKADLKLKKYMKIDEIPTKEDVLNKFIKDNEKVKKKFRFQIIYILCIITLFIVIDTFYTKIIFLDLFIVFISFNLIYRHFALFHFNKKLFTPEWEEKTLEKVINEF